MACNPFKIVVPGALWLVLISVACSGPSSPQHETGSSVEPEAVAPGGNPGNATTPGKWEEEVDNVVDEGSPASDEAPGPGRWRPFRAESGDAALTEEQQQQIEQLDAIGYLAGSMPAHETTGVVRHDATRAFQGLNFYMSGHAPAAMLMDMAGNVLHEWRREFRSVWPKHRAKDTHLGAAHWRRAYLLENGDVLAIFEGLGVIKVDRDSRLIWANPCRAHHDLEVMPDGDIYVLARAARIVDYVDPNRPILEDFVLVLDEHGKEKRRVSLLHAFEHSKYRAFWRKSGKRRGDIFHTNTLEVLDGRIAGRIPEFTAGNILTSMLNLDAIAVVDMDREQVVWAQRGKFRRQHDPQVLENGNLLLFDNRGLPGQSRVLEFDPDDMSLVWSYQGTEAAPFYSRTCGVCQRLPNGNTLITETDNGRAFEVTPAGEIVWEFYNPERAGKQLEFIAALFVVLRLPPDFPLDWLESRGP